MNSRASYNHRPIQTVGSLCLALGIDEESLRAIAIRANGMWRVATSIQKADGNIRQTYDAHAPLKAIHKRIKDALLCQVTFPHYLTGSLKGRDARTNAGIHADARIAICEDIAGFFPSTSDKVVNDIWAGFFGFAPEVAAILTALTTRHGALPQGGIASSYLANLAFWRFEPQLHDDLLARGIRYSRYVDDIALSSRRFVPPAEKTELISRVYGMLRECGYQPKRAKHEVFTNCGPIVITKLVSNRRAALPASERANIRAAVYQLERRIQRGERGAPVLQALNRVAGRVGRLKSMHTADWQSLSGRVSVVRAALAAEQTSGIVNMHPHGGTFGAERTR